MVNEITAIANSVGSAWVTPAYDAAGNTTTFPQTASPTASFTAVYDAWNRMAVVSNSSGTVVTYSYDGRNRRIVSVIAVTSQTRHFYYTNSWQDIEERIGTATTADNQYVWGIRYIDELVCRDDATPRRLYACQDANFNITAITDATGAVKERFVYDPYGNDTVLTASWTATTDSYNSNYRFQGGRLELDTGLYYFRSRDYSTAMGRWAQRDPLMYADTTSLYSYLAENPARFLDPSGLAKCVCKCKSLKVEILSFSTNLAKAVELIGGNFSVLATADTELVEGDKPARCDFKREVTDDETTTVQGKSNEEKDKKPRPDDPLPRNVGSLKKDPTKLVNRDGPGLAVKAKLLPASKKAHYRVWVVDGDGAENKACSKEYDITLDIDANSATTWTPAVPQMELGDDKKFRVVKEGKPVTIE